MISIKGLSKIYGQGENKVVALDNISLYIPRGAFVAIVGKSGSGKSTLLNLIGALDKVTEGNICIDDTYINQLDKNKLAEYRNQRVGFVFQSFYLEPSFSVVENVEMPLVIAGMDKKQYRQKAIEIIIRMGLEDKIHKKINTLSGGQKQRVCIARALVHSPDIILADEPTGNLDNKNGEEIIKILSELNNQGRTVILVTHNMQDALQAEWLIQLSDGKVTSIINQRAQDDED